MRPQKLTITVLLLAFFLQNPPVKGQVTLYDLNTIQKIEISFTQPNWDYMMDTAKYGAQGYLMSEWVKVNGVQFDSAGVKYKGTSSYDSTYVKNPLHISLDEFKDQSYEGITSIKLANCYADPSMIREVLSYHILQDYMDCPRSNFAQVYINGVYYGLYSNDESINKKFCSNHFYSSKNTFIKCSPVTAGPYSRSNLKYISSDSSDYFDLYEMESDYGWNDLVAVCDTITNYPSSVPSMLDMDRAIWMLAFNNVLVNLDSYSGWFSQNHYLYEDNTKHFNSIVWDLNMSLGGFPFAGSQGGGSGSLTVPDMQQLTPLLHASDNDWPLINVILGDQEYMKMYIAHMRTLVAENFVNGYYQTVATQLQALIDTAVQSDTNKFFSYDDFLNGMTSDVTFASYVIPGIGTLMEARTTYLLSTPEFLSPPPLITDVTPGDPEPFYNSEVTITAHVTNTNSDAVRLGLRLDMSGKFSRMLMYDDGEHNDGLAGDDVYGVTFILNALQAQYYVYAENDDACAFAPERAEHEYYTLQAQLPVVSPGDVLINEFLAKNENDTVNEYGNHEDWIELYNTTGSPVDLFGLYLSDDFSNPTKFAFPENTIIEPGSYLPIWADEENSTSSYIHCNFKLSAGGEEIILSDGAETVIDSTSFGPQTADVSTGRCPDGSGAFVALTTPTFNSANACPSGFDSFIAEGTELKVYPNPTHERITVVLNQEGDFTVELLGTGGTVLAATKFTNRMAQFNTAGFPTGLYMIMVKNNSGTIEQTAKILVMK